MQPWAGGEGCLARGALGAEGLLAADLVGDNAGRREESITMPILSSSSAQPPLYKCDADGSFDLEKASCPSYYGGDGVMQPTKCPAPKKMADSEGLLPWDLWYIHECDVIRFVMG